MTTSHIPFRFQAMWLSHPDLMNLVRSSWDAPTPTKFPISKVMMKLKRLKQELKIWNKEVFGNIYDNLDNIYSKIAEIQHLASSIGYSEELWFKEVNAQSEYCSILQQKDILLKQKSRSYWLTDGDRNTAFFHRAIKIKHSSEGINALIINCITCTDPLQIKNHIFEFYVKLFKNVMSPCPANIQLISSIIPSCVSTHQNLILSVVPSAEEIKTTVFDMSTNSAPGPDGFNGQFYHHFWEIIGKDVIAAICSFFSLGSFPEGLNSSFVVLIPKLVHANKVEDYRPIVLGNFIYKIISNILATRLGNIVASFVSTNQVGY